MDLYLSRIKSVVLLEDFVYFVSGYYRDLYRINLTDFTLNIICKLPFNGENFMPVDVIYHGNSIWCIPIKGTDIFEYNTITGEQKLYQYKNNDIINVDRENACAIVYNDNILIVPRYLPDDIIIFNTANKTFVADILWSDELINNCVEGKVLSYYFDTDQLVMVLAGTRNIIAYTLSDNKITRYELNVSDKLGCITKMGNFYYITAENTRKLIRWNKSTNETKEFCGTSNLNKKYYRPFSLGDKVIIADESQLDLYSDSEIRHIETHIIENDNILGSLFIADINYKNKYYLFPWNAKYIMIVDSFESVSFIPIMIPLENLMEQVEYLNEQTFSLEDYLMRITSNSSRCLEEKRNTGESYGEQIYNYLKLRT